MANRCLVSQYDVLTRERDLVVYRFMVSAHKIFFTNNLKATFLTSSKMRILLHGNHSNFTKYFRQNVFSLV